MKKLQPYTKEWLEELCAESYSLAEVLRKAGRQPGGGNQSILKQKIKEFDIDISHFTGQLWSKGKTAAEDSRIRNKSNDDLFCENSTHSRSTIRKRILSQNLIEYKCAFCGNEGEWLGQKMSLELDHINGKFDDHRLENLRFLCPNCHSLTPTWRRKKENEE